MAPTTTQPGPTTPARRGSPGGAVVELTGAPLTVDDVVAVARHGAVVRVTDRALQAMAASRAVVDSLAADPRPHYGISTGFGALARTHIPADRRAQLQLSLVRSHAAGSGAEVETEVVRALQLLRLATLATGRTGARPATAEVYAAMLNARITPVVREYGSLGCSGDLAPLAHVALAAVGEGEVRDAAGTLRPAARALADAGIEPVVIGEKEGLALINGTDGMLGMLCLAIDDLRRLLTTADVAAASSVEALLGSDAPFAEDLVAMRPHPGQAASAANLRTLLAGSPIVASHRAVDADGNPECTRVQDAYSLRCAPQVHGAARDTLAHAEAVATRELAAAIDNPVVTVDGRVESNGNFHGAPVAYVLDFLAIAVADVASISERRTDRFLDVARNEGLPPFLAHEPGVDSGHMIAQYTAAGIVSELKRLAAPASVDSIPSSAMQEDHVSMGWAAARKLRRSLDGLGRVLAIELLTAARALDLRSDLSEAQWAMAHHGSDTPAAASGVSETQWAMPHHGSDTPAPAPDDARGLRPAAGTGAVRDLVRTVVAGPGPDRYLSPEIDAVHRLVHDGDIVAAASSAVGHLD